MQTSNTRKNKSQTNHQTPIDNLQAAECKQLHQTPISKYGGGGARAAWRIRIRRPRLAERGARGVSDLGSDFCRLLTSDGPRPIRRPIPQIPPWQALRRPQVPNVEFLADFLPIENS